MYNYPTSVLSPRANVSNVRPIFDGGENEWSAALLLWDGQPILGVRWNGGGTLSGRDKPHPGQPNSRGLPTWFVIPEPITASVLVALKAHGLGGENIDAEQATRWVDKELQDRQADPSAVPDADFVRRVTEIVVEMKKTGQI